MLSLFHPRRLTIVLVRIYSQTFGTHVVPVGRDVPVVSNTHLYYLTFKPYVCQTFIMDALAFRYMRLSKISLSILHERERQSVIPDGTFTCTYIKAPKRREFLPHYYHIYEMDDYIIRNSSHKIENRSRIIIV